MPKKGTPEYEIWRKKFAEKHSSKETPPAVVKETPPVSISPKIKPLKPETSSIDAGLPAWQCRNCDGTCSIPEECCYPQLLKTTKKEDLLSEEDFSEGSLEKDFEEE